MASSDKLSVLGIAGSLRRQSFNKAVLRAAVELCPEDMKIDIFDLEGIPPYNQDLEQDPPSRVRELKQQVRAADAVLIVTPEYNYSIPGVLKNAIDWASRPYGDNAFDNKVVGIMGASIGTLGSARAQYHLRQSFVFLNVHTLNGPEVMVPHVADKVDANGRLTDETARKLIVQLLQRLADLTRKLGR